MESPREFTNVKIHTGDTGALVIKEHKARDTWDARVDRINN